MRTFFEIKSAQDENLIFEVTEVQTGYSFKTFEVAVSGLTGASKALLKEVARKYEADTSEPTESDLSFSLAVEQEDSPEEWVNTLLEDMNTPYSENKKEKSMGKEIDLTIETVSLFSYHLLGALQRGKGKELVERAEESLRIQSFLYWQPFDADLLKRAKLNVYLCFKNLDNFLQEQEIEFKNKENAIKNN